MTVITEQSEGGREGRRFISKDWGKVLVGGGACLGDSESDDSHASIQGAELSFKGSKCHSTNWTCTSLGAADWLLFLTPK